MMKKVKCVEYYYDSNTYTRNELIENFNREKEKYFDKIVDIEIELNEWGVYVVKLEFKNKKKYFQKDFNNLEKEKKERKQKEALVKKKPSVIKKYYEKIVGIIDRFRQVLENRKNNAKIKYESKLDKYYQNGKNVKIKEHRQKLESNYNKKVYGQYKSTGTFKPY